MFDRACVLLSTLLIATLCVAGCGQEESADPAPDEAAPVADAGDDAGEAGTAEGDTVATDDTDAPADAQPEKPVAPSPATAAPVPPGVPADEVTRAGWLSYSTAQQPDELAAFYQKALTGQGWTLGRNDSKKIAGTTLTGVVQEYKKGSELLTVCLTEQLAHEGTVTMVVVMDTPLPPDTTQVVAFANQAVVETPQSPDETLAFFQKHLAPLGWTSKSTSEAGRTKSMGFSKDSRTLSLNVRPAGGGKSGTTLTMMQIAYGD